jgi:phosphoglycolate phosphatase-like HAD superfamily hydrolase
MKKRSLIVFDIDGTLTDSVIRHQKAFIETLFEIGVSEINSEFKSFKHHTDSFIAKEIYENNQKKAFSQEKMQQFENGLSERIKLFNFNEIKGAKELVEKLQKETEFGVCYATGSLREPAEHKLNSIGIEFKEWQLVASDKIYERENIVGKAIKNSSENYEVETFERIISVGDGLWDLLTADNLKLEFIGVGEENRELLIQEGAIRVLKDLTEFEIEKVHG